MIRASIGRQTTSGTTGTAAFELVAPTVKSCRVVTIDLRLATAVTSSFGLGRPAAKGITPTSPVALLSVTGGESSVVLTKTALAWATPPTVPAQFYRRVDFPATVNSRAIWEFETGLWVPAGGTLVIWNLATNGVVDVNVVIDE